MIGKLRLLVWSGGLALAAVVLLHGAPWPDVGSDPAEATMATIRLVAGSLATYLFLATVIAVRLPRLSPRFARRLVATIVGGTLLVTPMAAGASTSSAPPPGVEAPVLHRIDEPAPLLTAPDPVPGLPAVQSVTVSPGEHLWGIAERELSGRLGRVPTDDEVVPFWQALIELNRDRLADPDNADLVFAGQTFRLPS